MIIALHDGKYCWKFLATMEKTARLQIVPGDNPHVRKDIPGCNPRRDTILYKQS